MGTTTAPCETEIEQHFGLVGLAIRHLFKRHDEDLFQVGCEGLLKAIRSFDPERGVKFSSYAYNKIRWALMKHLTRDSILKVSRVDKENLIRIRKEGLVDGDPHDISKQTGLSIEQIQHALDLTNVHVISVEQPIYTDNSGSSVSVFDSLHYECDFTDIHATDFIRSLSEREIQVVSHRMGGLNQTDIGKNVGISQVHVSRILKNIKKKYLQYSEEMTAHNSGHS